MFQTLSIAAIALLGALLTFFSGFGLGTVLLPCFALFFPIETAIALTAIVHFSNNIFKIGLLGKHAVKEIVFAFGLPSLLFAFLGAWLLQKMATMQAFYTYEWLGHHFEITWVKLCIGALMLIFLALELSNVLEKLNPSRHFLWLGGVVSGFFGGLSGHQGALRSIFLVKYGLNKEQFLATGIVIACMVDVARLSLYARGTLLQTFQANFQTVLLAVLAAFCGSYFGAKLLHKMTNQHIQTIVWIGISVIALLLMLGIL